MITEKIDKYLTEVKKYPTQYDAEFVAELTNIFNGFSMGGLSPWAMNTFRNMDKMRMKLWDKAFGDNSPWQPKQVKNKITNRCYYY